MELPDWYCFVRPELAYLKIPGSICDPLESFRETILPVPLYKFSFNASFWTKTVKLLPDMPDCMRRILLPLQFHLDVPILQV
jgi:hypothetical protein